MLTVTSTAVELLRFPVESGRAVIAITAMAQAAAESGIVLQPTRTYQGHAEWLLLWGPGHPSRFGPMQCQQATGGHVIALDLGYWDREQTFRVSIDAAHPQAWVMRRTWSRDRVDRDQIVTGDVWDPTGPVLVAGLGTKAREQYGVDAIDAWERQQIAEAKALPGKRLVKYRPKRGGPIPPGTVPAEGGTIEQALTGCSLAVTWHSNVAVDAIRMGVPVVCRDGAAAAVCPSFITPHQRPLDPDVRDRFLGNLAWFQWRQQEAGACWQWLRETLA